MFILSSFWYRVDSEILYEKVNVMCVKFIAISNVHKKLNTGQLSTGRRTMISRHLLAILMSILEILIVIVCGNITHS